MLADVPKGLQTFFAPQVEQLEMREERASFGGYAVLPEDAGAGFLWVAGLGEHCLVSVHDFVLHEDIPLKEYPTESYALSLMSQSMTALAPVPKIQHRKAQNVVAFHQREETTAFTLPAQLRCQSTTLCFTPAYFAQAGALTGMDPDRIKERLATVAPNALPPSVVRCLRALVPAQGARPDMALRYAAKALEALAWTVREPDDAFQSSSALKGQQLVQDAVALMEAHLAEPLTLDDMARKLFVSRTALCSAFHEHSGKGVASRLMELRMERAEELLLATDAPIKEVARAVGFAHQSSFCAAFKRHIGCTPTALRQRL